MSDTRDGRFVDADKLIEENPKVDPEQLRDAQELVSMLRKSGVPRPSYGIVSPYQRTQQRTKKT